MIDVKGNVNDFVRRKKAGMLLLLKTEGQILEGKAKNDANWTDRTSNARQTINGGADRKGTGYVVYLQHGMRYGTYLELGTGVYGPNHHEITIRPKNKKALFFDGLPHPVKVVVSKGMRSKAVIKPTVEDNKDRILKDIDRYWRNS